MKKTVMARALLNAAMRLLAYTDSDQKDIAASAKKIAAAKQRFMKANSSLIDEINSLRASREQIDGQLKVKEKELGESFKVFDKKTGMSKTAKEIASTIAAAMSVHEDIDGLLARLTEDEKKMVSYRESEQLSYKGMFETLVTLLNGTEYEKYVNLLIEGGRKNIVEVERVIGQAVTTSRSFSKEYIDEYTRRAEELKKRSPNKTIPPLKADVSLRTAGITDVMKGLVDWLSSKFNSVARLLSGLWSKLTSRTSDLKKAQAFVKKLNNAAQSAN